MSTFDMLAKVRSMLDTAESLEQMGNLEAAANYRARATAIKDKYKFEEEQLIAQDQTALIPVHKEFIVYTGGVNNPDFEQSYLNMFHVCARSGDVKVHYGWTYQNGRQCIVAFVTGYESDIGFVDMLFTMARLVFTDRMEPKVQAEQTDQVNVYRLRSAGIERVRVAEMVWGRNARFDKAKLSAVGRLYKAECLNRKEDPALSGRGVTGKVYREHYAEGFVSKLGERLRRMRDAAGEFGGGLVLHGRKERVEEAYYERWPQYKPRPEIGVGSTKCDACEAAKKRKKDEGAQCKDHRLRAWTKADDAAWARRNSAAAVRGRGAGGVAATYVDLAGRTGKLEG